MGSHYQLCVSGAAAGPSVVAGKQLAYDLGRAVAENGCTLLTGATKGLPYHAARGATDGGGASVGISPASSRVAHAKKYRLPLDCFDYMIFTGMDYVGRDLFLVQSSDAVLTVGGRLGTLHEFTSAMEDNKPVGILTGAGGTSELIDEIMEAAGKRPGEKVFYDSDPKRLVERMIVLLDKLNVDNLELYRNPKSKE